MFSLRMLVPFGFQLPRPAHHRPPDVVADIVEPAGLRHRHAFLLIPGLVPDLPGPAVGTAAVTE